MNEFELIRQCFSFSGDGGAVSLGVGDDCALLDVPAGQQLAVTTDTLVEGVHFPVAADPAAIARRALRVNLSDLAAMGARPLGFQLALTLPAMDPDWVAPFSAALARDAAYFNCPLTGGDTTRGPLAVTITMLGAVAAGAALRREGAAAGDLVCVSGTLGDAALALDFLDGADAADFLLQRYWLPEPRLALGEQLAGVASAALDISDGLLQDVGHIARASGLGAEIRHASLPLSSVLLAEAGSEARARELALGGGDDYELCFTVAPAAFEAVHARAAGLGIAITPVGRMIAIDSGKAPVYCVDDEGQTMAVRCAGYDHFGPEGDGRGGEGERHD